MKPKTKFEKECFDIFNEYVECPDNVKEWAINKLFSGVIGFKGCSGKRKVSYCSRCGHQVFLTDDMAVNNDKCRIYDCPACQSKVTVLSKKLRKLVTVRNFKVTRVIKGIQFIFLYKLSMFQEKSHPSTFEFTTISANAFDSKHWIVIRRPNWLGKRKNGPVFGVYCETSKYDCSGFMDACPYPVELLPILRYRGFDLEGKSPLWNMVPDYGYFTYFNNPELTCLEIAAKRNDFDFVRHFISVCHRDIEIAKQVNHAYKIANRHHYVAEDWNLWIDMVNLLVNANKDIHNPKFVCPSDLHAAHQSALESAEYYRISCERKRRKEYFKNGPFDLFWHMEFNPNFYNEFKHIVREYGIAESKEDKQWREEMGILNRPIINLYFEDTVDMDTGEIVTIMHKNYDYGELIEENGVLYYRLKEEYRDIGIELTPDNIVLFPEVARNSSPRETTLSKTDDADKFKRLKSKFNGLVFIDAELTLMTLDSEIKYIEESRVMHNCISTLKYYLRENSLIMSARIDDNPIADVEISLIDFKIIQCYGPCNTNTPYRSRIEALIEANIDKIKERMNDKPGNPAD